MPALVFKNIDVHTGDVLEYICFIERRTLPRLMVNTIALNVFNLNGHFLHTVYGKPLLPTSLNVSNGPLYEREADLKNILYFNNKDTLLYKYFIAILPLKK